MCSAPSEILLESGGHNILSSYPAVAVVFAGYGQTTLQLLCVTILDIAEYLAFLPPGMYGCVLLVMLVMFALYLIHRAMREVGACCSKPTPSQVAPEVSSEELQARYETGGCNSPHTCDSPHEHVMHSDAVDALPPQPELWGRRVDFWVWIALGIFLVVATTLWILWNIYVANAIRSAVDDLLDILAKRIKSQIEHSTMTSCSKADLAKIAIEVEMQFLLVTAAHLL